MKKLDINKIIKSMKKYEVSEIIINNGADYYEIRSGNIKNPSQSPSPSLHQSAVEITQKDKEHPAVLEIKSTIVGTYHESSEKGKAPFITKGQNITVGETLCIIKAMNTFNEIKSEVNGKIKEIYLKNLEIVDYGKLLFEIEKI